MTSCENSNQYYQGLEDVSLHYITKLHANLKLSNRPLYELSRFRSVIVFALGEECVDEGNQKYSRKITVNAVLKIDNRYTHFVLPHDFKLELVYFIKTYSTLPIFIGNQLYYTCNEKKSFDELLHVYKSYHYDFKMRKQQLFSSVTNGIRHFINYGMTTDTQNNHNIGSPIHMRFSNNVVLPGICTCIFFNDKEKKYKTRVVFDYTHVLNKNIEYFIYPQLL